MRLYALLAMLFACQISLSQDIKVQAMDAFCYDGLSPFAVNSFVAIEGDDSEPLQGMQIIITDGFDPATDELTYTAGDGIDGTFDATTGIMTLTGNSDISTYREALKRVFFSTSAPRESATRSITISLSNLDFLPENGHFYQYFPQAGYSLEPCQRSRGYTGTVRTDGIPGHHYQQSRERLYYRTCSGLCLDRGY